MKAVCPKCVEDVALAAFVRENAWLDECSYCDARGEQVAVELGEVTGHIMSLVGKEYTDPANELPYDGREGGYQGTVIDNPGELFAEIDFDVENGDLLDDIYDDLGADVWLCRRDYWELEPHMRLMYGWEDFSQAVRHRRRYTFWNDYGNADDASHPDYLPPARVLNEVADAIRVAELVGTLDESATFWRARVHPTKQPLATAGDFATPPLDSATFANRMSPAGVAMFYGAESVDVANAEVVGNRPVEKGKSIFAASFSPARSLRVLDLVDLPEFPSFFEDRDQLRHALYFLIRFRQEIAKPVEKDGREHIDYAPTQAFSEFIRYELTIDKEPIDGIRYASSLGEGSCYVIFADHEACLPEPSEKWRAHEPILTFDPKSVQRFDAAWLPASSGS